MEIAPHGGCAKYAKEDDMKRIVVTLIPCLLVGTAVFFTVNHAARARLIMAAAGELPNIPGCPLHESCARALQEERAVSLPRFPAVGSGDLTGAGTAVLMAAAFLLIHGKRQEIRAAV
jgi:hypothetical protein